MKHKRIYISGKISGDKGYRLKFAAAQRMLEDAGYEAVNPAALVVEEAAWERAMRTALREMLKCDAVAVLEDWKDSRGAKIEAALAIEVYIPVMPIDKWIETSHNEDAKKEAKGEISTFVRSVERISRRSK